jgi:hypothetical protein
MTICSSIGAATSKVRFGYLDGIENQIPEIGDTSDGTGDVRCAK